VTWTQAGSLASEAVHARRYDAAGDPIDGPFQVTTTTDEFVADYKPTPVVLSTGDLLISFCHRAATSYMTKVQRYDAAGQALGVNFSISDGYTAPSGVRACWALKDLCQAYGIPLLSGKDSMYVDGVLPGRFGETHRVSGLPTLFFTAVIVIPDLRRVVNLDFKEPGDLIYLVGATHPELGGLGVLRAFGLCRTNCSPGPPTGFSVLL